jgi:hypothetical protein
MRHLSCTVDSNLTLIPCISVSATFVSITMKTVVFIHINMIHVCLNESHEQTARCNFFNSKINEEIITY